MLQAKIPSFHYGENNVLIEVRALISHLPECRVPERGTVNRQSLRVSLLFRLGEPDSR